MLDYMPQGELFKLLEQYIRFTPALASFYAAQIVQFFHHMHTHGMIYRDLKPENILMQKNGYIKVTDFGFVKSLSVGQRTYTLCGTPEYLAPEVILNKGHNKAADWYTLGILIYELTVGRPPFQNEDPYKIFEMITNNKILFPRGHDEATKSIIRHLCDHDLTKRYGCLKNGIEDVKGHTFFKNINFKTLNSMETRAPHVPEKLSKKLVNQATGVNGMTHDKIPEARDCSNRSIAKYEDPFLSWF